MQLVRGPVLTAQIHVPVPFHGEPWAHRAAVWFSVRSGPQRAVDSEVLTFGRVLFILVYRHTLCSTFSSYLRLTIRKKKCNLQNRWVAAVVERDRETAMEPGGDRCTGIEIIESATQRDGEGCGDRCVPLPDGTEGGQSCDWEGWRQMASGEDVWRPYNWHLTHTLTLWHAGFLQGMELKKGISLPNWLGLLFPCVA